MDSTTKKAIWFTGLSGSGKSTLALALKPMLEQKGYKTTILDGDILRSGLNSDLGFTMDDRTENLRRAAHLTNVLLNFNNIVLCTFISPTVVQRKLVQGIIGKDNFILIHVDCSLEDCEQRDPKGLYAKARRGEIDNFTGIDSAYEKPLKTDISINTDLLNIEECTRAIMANIAL